MKRKYDVRNKLSFVIILILSLAVICIFSLFIYKYSKNSKIEYLIDSGSIIQDNLKNSISITDDAKLKLRWNGNYYLIYQDNSISLGKKVIVYNTISEDISLYGTFYEIQENGEIVVSSDEILLSSNDGYKFYKLDDREYLLIDKSIVSDDNSIDASRYLLVELDKQGNAKLSNYELNLKTITPTKLIGTNYVFDIANEILNIGSREIDLKKIIGSTNTYQEDEDDENDDDDISSSGNSSTGSSIINNTWNTSNDISTSGNSSSGGVINNSENGNVTDINEIINKTKMTSIVRVVEGLTQIDIDYVIYDPYNEYQSVYMEVYKSGKVDVIYLSKNDTHEVIDNLIPNCEYKVKFIYTVIDSESGDIKSNTIDEMTLKTKMPEYSIAVYKMSNVSNTLSYKVTLDSGYSVEKVNVNLSFKYKVIDSNNETVWKTASIDGYLDNFGDEKSIIGNFSIAGYDIDKDTLLYLKIVSVEDGTRVLNVNSSYTFRFGR